MNLKKQRGRPRKADEVKLSARISFAITKEEADQLYKKARIARMDVGPWIRKQLRDFGISKIQKPATV